jgi:hypothetical protein
MPDAFLNTAIGRFSTYGPKEMSSNAGPWLLGIEWGYIGSDHVQDNNNTGISGVVPAQRLLEWLYSPTLVAQRSIEQAEEFDQARRNLSVETDSNPQG